MCVCVCVFQSEGRKCRWNTVCVCFRVKEGSVGGTLCVCVCVFQSEGRKCRWNTVCVCVSE